LIDENKELIFVVAGGDGSLIGTLMKAKAAGVDIENLKSCVLPYGTGNDFCRVTNWGVRPNTPMYATIKSIVTEICENTTVKNINVWHINIKFKPDGRLYEVNP
jgi:hypothetical protein